MLFRSPPPLLTLPTQHATATHPAPSPTHYHTPPDMQYLATHQTSVSLYPNPPSLHAIPYITSSSSAPTQSLHLPQTSALAPRTHYPSVPHIVITPQSHIPQLNTQDGYQQAVQLQMTIIFFMGSDAQCTTTIKQHDGDDKSNSNFLGQTNLYSIISCTIQGLNTKKQKHTVQLISELANNEKTLTITLTETHLNEKILDSEIQMKNYI